MPSDNNDVWRLKDAYLRVAWRGDLDRLGREARLLEALRGVVPVPEVLAHGRSDTLSWSPQRAVPGRPLGEAVGGAGGRDLFRQAVEGLRALHAWSVPEGLASDLTPGAGPVRDRIGWELVVLPRVGVLDLVELTRRAPHPDLGARLWLYAISYALRQALFWPADRAESAGLDLSHPLHSLRRLVQAPLPLG